MPYPHDDAKLKSWETDRAAAVAKDPAAWNLYDAQVQTIVATYNTFLAGKGGYGKLDWQWVKAVLWVESGATSPQWQTKPMQIGVPHDPGLTGLLTTSAGKLILPPEYSKVLTFSSVTTNPVFNIEAGTGYLLQRLAFFGMVPVPPEAAPASHFDQSSGLLAGVQSGAGLLQLDHSTLGTPAAHPGSAQTNPGRPTGGLKLPISGTPLPQASAHGHGSKAHKGKHSAAHKRTQQAITGWRPATADMIALRYNGGGDGNYSGKLQFCYDMVRGVIDPADPFPKPDPAKGGKK